MKTFVKKIIGLLPFLLVAAWIPSCDDDDRRYDDDCTPGDPVDGRDCECVGNDCICPSSGDCGIYCTDDCDLQCAGSGNCDFLCDDGCDIDCTGSGDCDVEVDQDSRVNCTGSGDCEVHCTGDCTVNCPGSGSCTILCDPGVDCEFDRCERGAEDCGGGVSVCDGSCPG